MNIGFNAIGFSNISGIKNIRYMIEYAIKNATSQKTKEFENFILCEYSYEIADGVGILIRGELTSNNEFFIDSYSAYIIGRNISSKEEIIYEKCHTNLNITCMSDDVRVGVSLIFRLLNICDYLTFEKNALESQSKRAIRLSSFSNKGTILFPIMKNENQIKLEKSHKNNRATLINKARKGDLEALELLTLEDLDTYSIISKRSLKEDIFAIVDTSIMPNGLLCDEYNILGEILAYTVNINTLTKEEFYVITTLCNDVLIDVCINKNDLLGELKTGRRFKGTVFMQGYIEYI